MEARPSAPEPHRRIVRRNEANRHQRQLLGEGYESLVPIYRHRLPGPKGSLSLNPPQADPARCPAAMAGGAS